MRKLHQVIALVPSVKNKSTAQISEIHKLNQKSALFDGITKTYRPVDEDGEKFPAEVKKVERSVKESLEVVRRCKSELFDVVALQDYANTLAKANVVVDEKEILKNVPVTHLLFLEKQCKDLETFIKEIPTLSDDIEWEYDQNSDTYRSKPFETLKTAKIETPIVLYEATKEHPAQVQLRTEDKRIGHWTHTKFSRAMPTKEKREMLERIQKLQTAIVLAREEANAFEIDKSEVIKEGESIFDYVFNGQ